jgi:hypothetical protein
VQLSEVRESNRRLHSSLVEFHLARDDEIPSIVLGAFKGQKRASHHGNAGIPGILGNVVSVTYRI